MAQEPEAQESGAQLPQIHSWLQFWYGIAEIAKSFLLEVARAAVALLLTVILLVTVMLAFSKGGPETGTLLQVLLPVEAALLGSAVAFYFRSASQ